jgi:thiamine biosynthesis lipoprotein
VTEREAVEREAVERIDCFGSTCAGLVIGDGALGDARQAAATVCRTLLAWHHDFSRFRPDSELSRLNGDPRETVEVSPVMARLAEAIRYAATLTRGLVDGTLLAQIETAGYRSDLGAGLELSRALRLAPRRRAARPAPQSDWRRLHVDLGALTVTRPVGLQLDSGGLAKGLFADVIAERLAGHASFAVDCGGDLAIGGAAGAPREIVVESPFDATPLHTFMRRRTGVATSGIGRRSWLDERGRPAHHLLDPSTGCPVFSGVVQATALAPSALLADVYAKAAVLAGPDGAASWLRHGGVVVFEDGSYEVVEPAAEVTLPNTDSLRLASSAPPRPKEAASASVRSSAASGRENR